MSTTRTVSFVADYFEDFFNGLEEKVQEKVVKTFAAIQHIKIPPQKILKKIQGDKDLFEVRIRHKNDQYRILGYFEDGHYSDEFVILNCFQKKGNKDYPPQIKKANKIKKRYNEEKEDPD